MDTRGFQLEHTHRSTMDVGGSVVALQGSASFLWGSMILMVQILIYVVSVPSGLYGSCSSLSLLIFLLQFWLVSSVIPSGSITAVVLPQSIGFFCCSSGFLFCFSGPSGSI